jgi:PAT family beta-lactamase induction signal transducer AmpG
MGEIADRDPAGTHKPARANLTLTGNRWLRLLTLCSLYISQGLPQGFVYIALKNHLYNQGLSLAAVGGMLSLISIPWTFKFVWGPIIDRFGIPSMGKRRPWLIFSQGMSVLVILTLATIPEISTNLHTLGWAILSMNIFIALQDVSTDSLAVDIVPEKDRGKVNGMMYGSSYLGGFIGGAFIGHFLDMEGGSIQLALGVLGACVFTIMLLPLMFRERPGEKFLPWTKGASQLNAAEKHVKSARELVHTLVGAFKAPIAILAAVLALFVHLGATALANIGSQHFIKIVGWDSSAYSRLESIGYWFSFGGAVLGGFAADKLGAKRSVVASGGLLALDWILFSRLEPFWSHKWLIGGNMFLLAALMGFMSVSMFTLFMNIANRKVAASQFTAYMALLNLSIFTGNRIAGWFRDIVPSVSAAYLVAGLFHLSLMLFVLFAIRGDGKTRNPEAPAEDPTPH